MGVCFGRGVEEGIQLYACNVPFEEVRIIFFGPDKRNIAISHSVIPCDAIYDVIALFRQISVWNGIAWDFVK